MSEAIIDVFRALKLRDCGRPLPDSVIADWERSIGLQLPANYRRFLEVFNGGKFYPKFRYFFPIDMRVEMKRIFSRVFNTGCKFFVPSSPTS